MRPDQLIEQMKRANPDALQYLYNHYKVYCIGRLCRAFHCSPGDAEDVFMDALLIFRENVMQGKLNEVKHPQAYLYRICENRYREQQRRKAQIDQSKDAVRSSLYDPAPLPDDFSRKKEVVMRAFRYLSGNCRCILQYYYFDHLPLEEIAKKMGMANANVAKVTKSRCYKKWIEAVAALKEK